MTDAAKPLPPLSPATLKSVLRIRSAAIRDLKKCNYPGTTYLDHDRALEVMRTHALEELAVRVDFYIALRELPGDWGDRVARQVVHSAVSWFPLNEFYLRTPENQLTDERPAQFIPAIESTVSDHLIARLTAYCESWEQVSSAAVSTTPPEDRKALVAAYRAAFPEAGILDICWAAGQHYREWARWLKDQLKDDSRPDRSFRRILLSGRRTQELRREPRPKGWK